MSYGKTISEKIISGHCESCEVNRGEIVRASLDLLMGNDVSGSLAVNIFNKFGLKQVFDKGKIVLVGDHFVPNKDIASAEQAKVIRDFAREHGLLHYYENEGIEHALLPELGLVLPGQLIAGADSHSVTYGAVGAVSVGIGATDMAAALATGWLWLRVPESIKIVLKGKLNRWVTGKDVILHIIKTIGVDGATYKAMEFQGGGIANLTMESRLTIANMCAEAGAKNAIFPVDDRTREYLKERTSQEYRVYAGDDDAVYAETLEVELQGINLQVAHPHQPSNCRDVSESIGIKLDQVVIGSCTNGWLEDLRVAARILKGRRVHGDLRLIVIPGTRQTYKQALREGLLEIFVEAGGVVSPPTCGPCLGGYMGVLAGGETALSTTNRNFVGRMGARDSKVYLAGPAVAAASAIKGSIIHPDEVI